MLIQSGNNNVEIVATEVEPVGSPRAGDIRVNLDVNSEGFHGCSSAWVAVDDFADFLRQLQELEAARKGIAVLRSMSPGATQLEFKAIDRWGHIAIRGRLTKYGHAGGFDHVLEFGFEIESDRLAEIVAGFRRIARGDISSP